MPNPAPDETPRPARRHPEEQHDGHERHRKRHDLGDIEEVSLKIVNPDDPADYRIAASYVRLGREVCDDALAFRLAQVDAQRALAAVAAEVVGRHALRRIAKHIPVKRQTLLFSATFSDDIRQLAGGILRDPVMVITLSGWVDAGLAGIGTVAVLRDHLGHARLHNSGIGDVAGPA